MNGILIKFAFRNIFLHKMKTLIVGSILIFGSFLAVLGNSIVDAIASGMKSSITQSVTGDLQIYSDQAKEKLSVFGNIDGSPSDVGYVPNFSKIKESLLRLPNVRSIIPMGGNFALMNPGNVIDIQVEKLRQLYKKKDQPSSAKSVSRDQIENAKKQLHFLLTDLSEGVKENRAEMILDAQSEIDEAKEQLALTLEPSFWSDFDEHYESKLEFIGNKVAPLIFDNNMLYFNYLGTDLEAFKNNFPQFEIVKGQMIPQGERGFLIHDYVYETMVKNRIARRLDDIKKSIQEDQKSISSSKELQDLIKANKEQISELYLTIDYSYRPELIKKMKVFLKASEEDLRTLLGLFFDMKEENFMARYDFFYKDMAPYFQLYKVAIGDVIPLTAMTKLGSSSAVNIKVWGTFHFKSFENSPLAGNFSLIDLNSFRDLYGFLTESRRKQNREIEKEMGLQDLGKDDMEALFGATEEEGAGSDTNANGSIETNGNSKSTTQEKPSGQSPVLNEKNDVFINAAVFLKDPAQLTEALEEITQKSKNEKLEIQAADWRSASGMVGQMTTALRIILFGFVLILFIIASLMIMNSLLMATLERQQEIGTMRAIGAPKSFLYKVYLIETAVTSILFSFIGTVLALAVIMTIGKSGIPAQGEVAKFFFSGPKLYFSTHWDQILLVFVIILIISFIATQYPAWRAMKISPLRAMQNRD